MLPLLGWQGPQVVDGGVEVARCPEHGGISEQVQGIVDRRRLQRPNHRGDHRRALRFRGAGQVRGLRAQPALRQCAQPVRRNLLDLHLPQAEGRDLVDPLQHALHRVAGGPSRRPAHPLQLREPLSLRHLQQRDQVPGQRGVREAGRVRHRRVQPLLSDPAHFRDLPGQHAHPRQQHPVPAQPVHRLVEQRHRPLGIRPRPAVQEHTEQPAPLRVFVLVVAVRRPVSPTRARTPSSAARGTA